MLAVAIQSDLKTVVVGQQGDRYFILRYLTNGKHDKAFGNGGLIAGRFNGTNDSLATAVAIQSDGKILIAGEAIGGADLTHSVALRASTPTDRATAVSASLWSAWMKDFSPIAAMATLQRNSPRPVRKRPSK